MRGREVILRPEGPKATPNKGFRPSGADEISHSLPSAYALGYSLPRLRRFRYLPRIFKKSALGAGTP